MSLSGEPSPFELLRGFRASTDDTLTVYSGRSADSLPIRHILDTDSLST